MKKPDSGTECGAHVWGTLVSKTFSALPAEGLHLCQGQAHPHGKRLPGRSAGQKKRGGLGEEDCCHGPSPRKHLSTELAASEQQPRKGEPPESAGAHTPAPRGRVLFSECENTRAERLSSRSQSLSWLLPAVLDSEPHSQCAQRPFPTTPRKGKGQNICPRVSMIPTATIRG